jgi:hypothetical protein
MHVCHLIQTVSQNSCIHHDVLALCDDDWNVTALLSTSAERMRHLPKPAAVVHTQTTDRSPMDGLRLPLSADLLVYVNQLKVLVAWERYHVIITILCLD